MFCNQSCLTEGREIFHRAERDFIDIIYENYDSKLDQIGGGNPGGRNETIGKRILQSLAIAGSIKRLREIFESSERKTIFDFDMRGQDQQSKDLIYLTIVNSMRQTSDTLIKNPNEISASDYLRLIGQKHFMKSNKDRKDLKKYLVFLLSIDYVNYAGIKSYQNVGLFDGHCFLPFGFLFNHSCDPNVEFLSIDDKTVIVVINPVRKGDQLFVCYG